MKTYKIYYPSPKFPAISLSGNFCRLKCRHCDATYLGGMRPAETPEMLLEVCRTLKRGGANGVLLSGGSDEEGRLLNLATMTETLHQAKRETGLLFNIHPGLLDAATTRDLAVDFASLEIPSEALIHDVFGLTATTEDYLDTYRYLQGAGIEVIPHVNVFTGDEDTVLDGLSTPPRVLVIIVFSPTPCTPLAREHAPSPDVIGALVARIKKRFPATELALGCMRPRQRTHREATELAAIEAGITRLAMPSRSTLRHFAGAGHTLRTFDACCALPVAHEALCERAT